MLDDLKFIHEKDAQDALGIAEKEWQQLLHVYDLKLEVGEIENIVFAGMGGSALAATMSLTWPGYSVPFETCRNYDIPAYVSDKTLFIASSYSGNTEETIEALHKAEERQAHIVVVASGGRLQELAEQKHLPFVLLPQTSQPRYAAFYSFKALLTILVAAGLEAPDTVEKQLQEASELLQEAVQTWLPTVPTKDNVAKQIAQEVIGKSIVIYAGPKFFPAAYKWKISFNENAKNVAWCNQYPEFNHNEFLGWTSHPTHKPYAVIDLRSSLEHPRVQKRFEVSERLLSGKRPAPIVVEARGTNELQQLVWTVVLGDFVSLYTALLNGLNPTPVDLIEKFKKSLDD